jgi:hypothetical protein
MIQTNNAGFACLSVMALAARNEVLVSSHHVFAFCLNIKRWVSRYAVK